MDIRFRGGKIIILGEGGNGPFINIRIYDRDTINSVVGNALAGHAGSLEFDAHHKKKKRKSKPSTLPRRHIYVNSPHRSTAGRLGLDRL